MATYFIDTSFIIDILRGYATRAQVVKKLLDDGHTLACCAVNVAEIFSGMRPKEKSATESFLQSLEYAEISWDIARHAGDLKNEYARRGKTLSLPDCLIAAICIDSGYSLLTNNIKDFPMSDLQLYPL